MKLKFKEAIWLVSVVLSAAIGFNVGQRQNDSRAVTQQRSDTTIQVTVSYDSISKRFPERVPVPYAVQVPGPERWRNVDTGAILKDYFTKYVSTDEYADSLITIKIQDTVTQNRTTFRNLSYELLLPKEKEIRTVTNEVPMHAWFYSGSVSGSNQILAPGVGLDYITNEWSAGGQLLVPVTGQKPIIQLQFSKRF